MDWTRPAAVGFFRPLIADEHRRCGAFERLAAAAKVVGCDEVSEVMFGLFVAVVVETLDGGVLEGAVHPLDRPFVQECLILVKRCSIPFSRQRIANMWVM